MENNKKRTKNERNIPLISAEVGKYQQLLQENRQLFKEEIKIIEDTE